MSLDIPIGEVVYFDAITSSPTTGAATDADSTPTFAVYEEATDTDIGVGGNLTKRTSLTGNYRGSFTASLANGFEVGKWYSVIGSATVGAIAGKSVLLHFRIIDSVYFANIKYVKDTTNLRDEYSTIWYKDNDVIPSASLTNPAISVYNTSTGASVFQDQIMSYASTQLGVVRYNDGSFLSMSGEPYLIIVSGTIDSATRKWQQIVGLDLY